MGIEIRSSKGEPGRPVILLGLDVTNNKFVPVQVDSNGKLIVSF
jgi:hypothetical protein